MRNWWRQAVSRVHESGRMAAERAESTRLDLRNRGPMMTLAKRAAKLELLVEEISQRLVALERRMDHQVSNVELHRLKMREMEDGVEALEGQTPVNSATREVMWRRIEALEGTPSEEEELPPMMAAILRRLAVLEERIR